MKNNDNKQIKKLKQINPNPNKTIKNKILKHLIIKGKKETGEKVFLKSIKKLQKLSKKETEEWIKLAIIFATPVYKVHKKIIKRKRKTFLKETPFIMVNQLTRISLAIKFFLIEIKKDHLFKSFYIKLANVWITNTNNEGLTVQMKNHWQERALLKKHSMGIFYRWL